MMPLKRSIFLLKRSIGWTGRGAQFGNNRRIFRRPWIDGGTGPTPEPEEINLFEPGDTWVGSGDWVDNGDGTWSITAPLAGTNLVNQDADARVTPLFPGDFDITFNILSSNGGNWRMLVGNNFVQGNATGIVTSSYLGVSRLGVNYGIQARAGTTMTVRIDTAKLVNTG